MQLTTVLTFLASTAVAAAAPGRDPPVHPAPSSVAPPVYGPGPSSSIAAPPSESSYYPYPPPGGCPPGGPPPGESPPGGKPPGGKPPGGKPPGSGPGAPGFTCSQEGYEPSCCNGAGLLGSLLGSQCDLISVHTCSQQQACCKVDNSGDALINLGLCIPINL